MQVYHIKNYRPSSKYIHCIVDNEQQSCLYNHLTTKEMHTCTIFNNPNQYLIIKKLFVSFTNQCCTQQQLTKIQAPWIQKSFQFFHLLKCIRAKCLSHTLNKLPFLTFLISKSLCNCLLAINIVIAYLNINLVTMHMPTTTQHH